MTLLLPGSRSIPLFGPVALCVAFYVYLSTSINISTASMGYQLQELHNTVVDERAASSSAAASVVNVSVPTNYTPLLQENSTGISSTSLKAPIDPIDICFVSSIFAPTTKTADRPKNFTDFDMGNTTSFQFFLYTNLEDLGSPGWTKVLRHFNYRRFITQSRWGKFMAWKDPEMKACQTVFYFDGIFKPAQSSKRFVELAKQIRESEFGLAQRPHPSKASVFGEFNTILRSKKDIQKNVNASIEWLQAQPDFYNNCTMYVNAFFGKSISCLKCVVVHTMLMSIRSPKSVCFVSVQAMILPMYIFKKRQSIFGIITRRRKILGAINPFGVIRLNALISSLYLLEADSLEQVMSEWDTGVIGTVLLKIMMRRVVL
jgi:hypothetical protein